MKTSLTKRLFLSLLLLLAVYTGVIVVIQQRLEADTRQEILQSELNAHTETIHQAYVDGNISRILPLLPEDLRVTVIADEGEVLVDTDVSNVGAMEKHDTRPELQEARFHKVGTAARRSSSTDVETYYFARYYGDHYIRTALPVTSVYSDKNLKTSDYFIYISIIVFVLMTILLFIIAQRYDNSIKRLRKLGNDISSGVPLDQVDLPDGDMGGIAKDLIGLFEQKEAAIKAAQDARQRLILHFKLSNIGIALFDKDGETEFTNSHFIQYANMLATRPMTDAKEIINEPLLTHIKHFLDDKTTQDNTYILTVTQSNATFEIKALKSQDGSYELTIEDITEEEKNRRLKQEMTSNITHEIRTPLTSIRGYLETLNFKDLTEEKRKEFTEKAYQQSIKVSEMMDDIRLLTKLDEDNQSFDYTPVNLSHVAEEIRVAYTSTFTKHGVTFHNELPTHLTVEGNQTLLYSIFQNLVENSLRYAGENIEIVIRSYYEDENFVHISYYDTGKGVDEKHLGRLFERFYRVDDGRTRHSGGSGLGLSIVKNAIHLHGGQVQARIHPSGGLEILFHLHK